MLVTDMNSLKEGKVVLAHSTTAIMTIMSMHVSCCIGLLYCALLGQ